MTRTCGDNERLTGMETQRLVFQDKDHLTVEHLYEGIKWCRVLAQLLTLIKRKHRDTSCLVVHKFTADYTALGIIYKCLRRKYLSFFKRCHKSNIIMYNVKSIMYK